jgi:2,2-dialkylglycine decarboxylase (pyruvate)
MIGIELVNDKTTKEPAYAEAKQFIKEGMEAGVMFGGGKYGGLSSVIKFKPPLVISDDEVDRVLEVTDRIIEKLSQQMLKA